MNIDIVLDKVASFIKEPGVYQLYVSRTNDCAIYKLRDDQILISAKSHAELSDGGATSGDEGIHGGSYRKLLYIRIRCAG